MLRTPSLVSGIINYLVDVVSRLANHSTAESHWLVARVRVGVRVVMMVVLWHLPLLEGVVEALLQLLLLVFDLSTRISFVRVGHG